MVRHDLRGALNALHLHLELLTSSDERVSDVHRREQAAAAIRTACGSVCALLPLAVEALPPVEAEADVVVSSLLESIATHLEPVLAARGLTITTEAEAPAGRETRTALEDARARLVGALLDVVEKSPRGSTIQVSVDPTRRRVLLTSAGRPASEVDLGPDAS